MCGGGGLKKSYIDFCSIQAVLIHHTGKENDTQWKVWAAIAEKLLDIYNSLTQGMPGQQWALLRTEWRYRWLGPDHAGQIPGKPGWELLRDTGNWPLDSQWWNVRSAKSNQRAVKWEENVPVYSSGAYIAPITGLIFHPEAWKKEKRIKDSIQFM